MSFRNTYDYDILTNWSVTELGKYYEKLAEKDLFNLGSIRQRYIIGRCAHHFLHQSYILRHLCNNQECDLVKNMQTLKDSTCMFTDV